MNDFAARNTTTPGARRDRTTPEGKPGPVPPDEGAARVDIIVESRRQEALLRAGALQTAIFNSANFSSIATDAKGVIQIF
ncbi:MAG: hypothetical protein WC681_22715, partial [Sterolibacterium sp.]